MVEHVTAEQWYFSSGMENKIVHFPTVYFTDKLPYMTTIQDNNNNNIIIATTLLLQGGTVRDTSALGGLLREGAPPLHRDAFKFYRTGGGEWREREGVSICNPDHREQFSSHESW